MILAYGLLADVVAGDLLMLDCFKKTLTSQELSIFTDRMLNGFPLSLSRMAVKLNQSINQIRYLEKVILKKYDHFFVTRGLTPPKLERKRATFHRKTWTFDACLEEAKKYPNIDEWRKHRPSYAAVLRNGWLEIILSQLARLKKHPFCHTKIYKFSNPQNATAFVATLTKKEKMVFDYRFCVKPLTLRQLANILSTSPEGIRVVEKRLRKKLAVFTHQYKEERKLFDLLLLQEPDLDLVLNKDHRAFAACLNEAKKHPNNSAWRAASLSTYGKAKRHGWLDHPDFIASLLAIDKNWFKRMRNKKPKPDDRSPLLRILEDPTVPDDKKEALQRIRNLLLGHQVEEKKTRRKKILNPNIVNALEDPNLTKEEKSAIMQVFGRAPEVAKPPKTKKKKNSGIPGWMFKYMKSRKKS